jgi:hypothetical protein
LLTFEDKDEENLTISRRLKKAKQKMRRKKSVEKLYFTIENET